MKTFNEFMLDCTQLNEGGLARQLNKAKTKTTGHISADRGSSEAKNRAKRKGLEKDLSKQALADVIRFVKSITPLEK